MTTPAVIFEHVSKKYRLTHFKQQSLKDQLTSRLARFNPFSAHTADKTEEDFWALNDVSFEIRPGECVGIIGPNGSGKSTTLKILSNVTQPTTGVARINGRLGALIEVGAGFHPELSGRENIFLNGSILGMSKAEIKAKFDSIVEFSEIAQFIDTPVKHYSSGMYVRLGFSIAIHNEPEVMLIDEILAVGDLGFQKKCFRKIEEFKHDGRTIVLVSHSMSQIQAVCERAILLQQGRLACDGHSDDVADMYIRLANPKAMDSYGNKPSKELSNFRISSPRFLSKRGAHVTNLPPGEDIIFEFDYESDIPIHNPTVILVFRREGTRIYSSNSNVLGVSFGFVPMNGTMRCDIGALPLMPNCFDVELHVYDEAQSTLFAVQTFPNLLNITVPENPSALGARYVPALIDRGVVFKRASWEVTSRNETEMSFWAERRRERS
ncbi:MAG: ABC transporter ATP-binding protein [Gammaproteobacteria bacterium]